MLKIAVRYGGVLGGGTKLPVVVVSWSYSLIKILNHLLFSFSFVSGYPHDFFHCFCVAVTM